MANGLTPRQLEILRSAGADTEKALKEVGMAEGITRSTLQGLTFGFADEIEAGIRQFLPKKFGGGEYDELVTDVREGLEQFRDENPGTAITSEIIGSIIPTIIATVATAPAGGSGGAAAVAGTTARLAPTFVKKAAEEAVKTQARKQAVIGAGTGGLYGLGTGEGGLGERATGGAIGAGIGTVGGAVGATLFPKMGEAASKLLERGVQLTPGQAFGGVPRMIEDAATVVPFAGQVVGEAQKRAKSQYSNVVVDDILSPLGIKIPKGKTGSEAVEFAQEKIGQEYEQILPKLSVKDASAMRSKLKDAADVKKILDETDIVLTDKSRKELDNLIKTSIKVLGGDEAESIAGQQIRKTEKILGRKATQYSKSPDPDQQDLGRILFDVQRQLREELVEQNPDAVRLLDIHSAYKKLLPVEKASIKSSALKEGGEFGPSELLSSISQKDKKLAAAGRAPMQEEALEALEVIGQPRGGIARPILEARALPMLATVGGLATATVPTMAGIAGLGAAYTQPGVRVTRGLLGLGSEAIPALTPVTAGKISGLLTEEE